MPSAALLLRHALHLTRGWKVTCDLRAPVNDALSVKLVLHPRLQCAAKFDYAFEEVNRTMGVGNVM